MTTATNTGHLGDLSGAGNPLCAAFDEALASARSRVWLAVPWVYTRSGSPWLLGFIDCVAAAAQERHLDVRAYLRPDPVNAQAVSRWLTAGVTVVQDRAGVRYLHSKVLVTDDAALIATANLTDTDLFRNPNHLSVERDPVQVRQCAESLRALDEDIQPTSPVAGEATRAEAVIPEDLRRRLGVERLNPMQSEAVPRVLHADRNLVVAAPTGSGKTLVGEVALLKEVLHRGNAGVYLAPMRAIAAEKRVDWQRLEESGLRLYKTTGEDDAFDPTQAQAADIIIATPEKWDSVSRRQLPPPLVARIGTIVIDEIHLVDDEGRGPGLEALLARIHLAFPAARLVAMSGTLTNADAIARWLRADLYESRWRPVALTTTVVPYPEAGDWRTNETVRNGLAAQIVGDTVTDGGAALVFCGSRKGVEGCATHLADALGLHGPSGTGAQLPSLRAALARGVGFHHAGLSRPDRAVVERLFRAGEIKVLGATSTVAAGVNLPARVVVVRDLTLGISEITSADLLQMAGRAGRVGLETEGRCYVLTPAREAARVEGLLGGRPIGSHLGADLATHLNTEVVLGIVRSRADVRAWYDRTLHAQLASGVVDLEGAVQQLVDGGFATEMEGVLAATELGRTTSDLMIRVASAAVLEAWLARRHARQADPTALELELLVAACGLPVEFADLPTRRDEDDVLRAAAAHFPEMRDWEQGRVRHFAVAASLLSGVRPSDLPLENGASVGAAAQQEVPRFLRFLARRAVSRSAPAADVGVAGADLAAALEFGVAERGAAPLLDVLRRAYPPDETRRRKVHNDYTRLRATGVDSLESALPHLAAVSRTAVESLPTLEPRITQRDTQLVGNLGRARRPMRVLTRLASDQREILRAVESADLGEVILGQVGELGRPGRRPVAVEVVAVQGAAVQLWRYARASAEVEVPAPRIDLAGAERLLRERQGTDYETAPRKGFWRSLADSVFGADPVATGARQVSEAPPRVRAAAAALSAGLVAAPEKAEAVTRLLEARQRVRGTGEPRSLGMTAGDDALTRAEAAILATALLTNMGVPARLVRATLDGEATLLCAWKDDQWYGAPIWPTARVQAQSDEPVAEWREDGGDGKARSHVGWEVLAAYERVSERRLPAMLAGPHPSGNGSNAMEMRGAAASLPCPRCGAAMREKTGKFGRFLSCERFPACKGTRNLGE